MAQKHGASDFYCTVSGPIADAPRADNSKGPLYELDANGTYMITNSLSRQIPLATHIARSYLPTSSPLGQNKALEVVDIYVQGQPLDMKENDWNQLDAKNLTRGQPSVVIPVKMDNPVDGGPLYNGNGEVAYLQYKKFDIPHRAKTEDLLYAGILVAMPSGRYLNNDPKAFYLDRLGTMPFVDNGKAVWQVLWSILGKNSLNKKAKIAYETICSYFDKKPSFTAAEWNKFWNDCMRRDDGAPHLLRSRPGLPLHRLALGTDGDRLLQVEAHLGAGAPRRRGAEAHALQACRCHLPDPR